MEKVLFVTATLIFFLNCESNKIQESNVDNPLVELVWLSEIKNQLDADCNSCEWSIRQGIYEDTIVYYISMTDPVCEPADYNIDFYNSEGRIVNTFTLSNSGNI